ncbi:helix-turn-helix transcriptional regulator [Paenibacillus glycanilyticus]|uniref:helix-turn-helix transcriptional regulator n=1 Tax=Paenibacillus glycanilyticus TaxID=126569 RepID=UPI00203AE16A|nr:helix-turn-helix transcriptional regulator [Paenibacillus glycanilyticus]MCM3626598.1 helix-turn-helix transcriptional regulator [Paenibacillus glycanilyticus]
MDDSVRLKELAQFLRTRRARLSPEQAGLEESGRRRTPGLRRGEVAMLSGVSVDWYTWLEQARPIQVSTQVLDSISRALRLDADERKHLFLLALPQLPSELTTVEHGINETLQSFLDHQGTSPAFITDQRLIIKAWNKAANAVYGPFEEMTERERNTVWRSFHLPGVRQLLRENWEKHARHRLAQFRAGYGKFPGDPWWMEMIGELQRTSEEFREWWPQHDVLNGPEGKKINYHPEAGILQFNQLSFIVSDSPNYTVTINLPADEQTVSKMEQLLP